MNKAFDYLNITSLPKLSIKFNGDTNKIHIFLICFNKHLAKCMLSLKISIKVALWLLRLRVSLLCNIEYFQMCPKLTNLRLVKGFQYPYESESIHAHRSMIILFSNTVQNRFVSNGYQSNKYYLSPKFPMPGSTWNLSLISASMALVTIFTLGNA